MLADFVLKWVLWLSRIRSNKIGRIQPRNITRNQIRKHRLILLNNHRFRYHIVLFCYCSDGIMKLFLIGSWNLISLNFVKYCFCLGLLFFVLCLACLADCSLFDCLLKFFMLCCSFLERIHRLFDVIRLLLISWEMTVG